MIKAWRNHCPAGLETGRPPGPGCLAIHTGRCLRTVVVYSCASAFVIDALCDTRIASVLPRTKAKCPRRPDLARGSGAGAMRSELIVNHLSGHDRNSPGADLACMCLFLGLDFCFGLLMKRPVIRKTITMIAGPAMAVGHGRTRGVVLARLTVLKICIVNFESRRHIPRARRGRAQEKACEFEVYCAQGPPRFIHRRFLGCICPYRCMQGPAAAPARGHGHAPVACRVRPTAHSAAE